MPIHLNSCVNLVELNMSNNNLHAFPRCLHLPKLRHLDISKNPLLVRFAKDEGTPLIEQFPRLVTVVLDPELKEVCLWLPYCTCVTINYAPLLFYFQMLRPQSLAYLCPQLNSINREEFEVEATEETIKAAQAAKQELATLVSMVPFHTIVDAIASFFITPCVPGLRFIPSGRMTWWSSSTKVFLTGIWCVSSKPLWRMQSTKASLLTSPSSTARLSW